MSSPYSYSIVFPFLQRIIVRGFDWRFRTSRKDIHNPFHGLEQLKMFNFLFDGKIGDILAPVVPSNQLFLAIQHHKNDQILGLLSSTGYNGHQQVNGNYSAIHVACRYNNRYAIDVLVQRGIVFYFFPRALL